MIIKKILFVLSCLFWANAAFAAAADDDLFAAAKEGSIAGIKIALERGAIITAQNTQGRTAYDIASGHAQQRTAVFLKSLKIVKYPTGVYVGQLKGGREHGWGVYHGADKTMYSGNFRNGKARGFGIWKGLDGQLYGGEFSEKGDHEKVVRLSEKDIYGKDRYGENPLFKAVKQGSIIKIRLLLDRNTDVNETGVRKQSPLHFAAFEGRMPVMELLLNAGASVDARDDDGMTPLHFAVWGGKQDVLELLLKRGADVRVRNINGSTPLHLAAYQNHSGIAELLLKKGAELNARDNSGKTPYEHAITLNHLSVARLLKRFGI